MVLVHGTMDRGTSFAKVWRRLGDLDVTVYDRRGYAGSRGAGPATAIDDHVDDLLAIVGDRPAVVFGHSLGGVVALAAAQRRPDLVRAVAAYEAPAPWAPWWPRATAGGRALHDHGADPAAAAEAFMRAMVGDRVWERLPDRSRRARRAEGPALLAEMAALRRDPPPFDPQLVDVPVLSGRGTRSRPHHRRAAADLADAVPGAVLVEVDGADHGAHLSHPDAVAAMVRDLLARTGPGRSEP